MMTNVVDLKHGDLHINIIVKVISVGEVKEFVKGEMAGKVCEAVVEDGSGQIKMSIWNEDTEKVREGDLIKITNGYVSEYQKEPRLSTGKFGTLEVLEGVKLKETSEDVEPNGEVKKDGKRGSRKKAKKL